MEDWKSMKTLQVFAERTCKVWGNSLKNERKILGQWPGNKNRAGNGKRSGIGAGDNRTIGHKPGNDAGGRNQIGDGDFIG